MAESITSKTDLQCDKTANIDLIFDYVVHHEYSVGASKNIKANIRTLSAKYVACSGQLYYKHKSDKASGDISELLVIRDLIIYHLITINMHLVYH